MGGLENKVAVVTGASRGIGRAYLSALADAGATVIGLARSFSGTPTSDGPPPPADLPSTERAEHDERPERLACDVADETSVTDVVRDILERHGRIDVLVNNAGVFPHHDPLTTSAADWNRIMQVNVWGLYLVTREVLPQMIERGEGSVINMSSGAALPTERGSAGHVDLMAYGVSKAAVDRITSFLGEELRPTGIAVNGLRPGGVLTDNWRNVDPEAWDNARTQGLGQQCAPEVVGPPMLHLAQQTSQTLTAQTFDARQFGISWP